MSKSFDGTQSCAQAGLEPHGNIMPTHLVLALRAVVELHKPIVSNDRDGHTCLACSSELSVAHPCPTIQAIEKELG